MSGNFTSMFDVYPLTGVGLDTFIQLSNLSLDQGGSYTAFVVALDQSGTCAMIGQGFGADMTPPTEGKIGIGPDLDLVRQFSKIQPSDVDVLENYTLR